MSQPDRIAGRLSAKKDKAIIEWLAGIEEGERSKEIKEALNAYLSGIFVMLDEDEPREAIIIEQLRPMGDQPRKMQEWIKARLFERLTGLDAITGKPLDKFTLVVKEPVIEYVEKPVYIKETVYMNGEPQAPQTQAEAEEGEIPQLNNQAHSQLGDLEW